MMLPCLFALAGCDQPAITEDMDVLDASKELRTAALRSCDDKLLEVLIKPESFKEVGDIRFSVSSDTGTLQRDFSAIDSSGVWRNTGYICKYGTATDRVLSFQTSDIVTHTINDPILQGEYIPPPGSAERVEKIKAGAARVMANHRMQQPSGSKAIGWITNMFMTGCPEASDWFEMQDAVRRFDMSVDLPPRCFKIQPGTIVITQPKGNRLNISHNGHAYERGVLENGQAFWTDEMDHRSLTPLN